MVHATRILVDNISGTGPFMSVQHPNMFPQPVVVDVQDLETPAKTYYRQCLQQQDMTPADFKGVTLDDLVVLEQVFSLNVYVYDLQETEAGDIAARLVRRSIPTCFHNRSHFEHR
jgi:hypothetical protein